MLSVVVSKKRTTFDGMVSGRDDDDDDGGDDLLNVIFDGRNVGDPEAKNADFFVLCMEMMGNQDTLVDAWLDFQSWDLDLDRIERINSLPP